jgi:pseudoazurin
MSAWHDRLALTLSMSLTLLTTVVRAETHTLFIKDHTDTESMVFIPFLLEVAIGDTVEFVSDNIGHVTQSVFVPAGGNEWKGKVGETVVVEMNREGIYIYECIFHSRLGMAGVIQAGGATNLEEARDFYRGYRQKLILYQERLDSIMERLE